MICDSQLFATDRSSRRRVIASYGIEGREGHASAGIQDLAVVVTAVGLWCGPALPAAESLSVSSQIIRPAPDEVDKSPPVITAVRLHPNGRFLVMAGDDHVVRIWDTQQRQMVHELRGHWDWVGWWPSRPTDVGWPVRVMISG